LVTGDKPPAPNTALSTAALAIKQAQGIVLILMARLDRLCLWAADGSPPSCSPGHCWRAERRRSPKATAVAVFVLIEFSLVIIPFVFLQVRRRARRRTSQRAQDWLMSHARQLMAVVALFADAYIVISGLERLLTQPDRCRLGSPSAACAAFPVHSVRLSA
jgi:hypothetical protein